MLTLFCVRSIGLVVVSVHGEGIRAEEQLCRGDSLEPLATSLSLEMQDLMLVRRLARGISSPSYRGKKS